MQYNTIQYTQILVTLEFHNSMGRISMIHICLIKIFHFMDKMILPQVTVKKHADLLMRKYHPSELKAC